MFSSFITLSLFIIIFFLDVTFLSALSWSVCTSLISSYFYILRTRPSFTTLPFFYVLFSPCWWRLISSILECSRVLLRSQTPGSLIRHVHCYSASFSHFSSSYAFVVCSTSLCPPSSSYTLLLVVPILLFDTSTVPLFPSSYSTLIYMFHFTPSFIFLLFFCCFVLAWSTLLFSSYS